MSARLRDRQVERMIREELQRNDARFERFDLKGSGNKEVVFVHRGKTGRFVFPRNPTSCSRTTKNMVHMLRRLIKGMEA